MYIEHMLDPKNAIKQMSSFDLNLAKEHAERIRPDETNGFKHHTFSALLNNFRNSHDGKNPCKIYR